MTNPNNAVGTNGAYGGRTSVEAFNDVMNILSRGIISGWECVPNSGLTVSLGGNGNIRDVAAAEDAAGNKTSINNRSGSPINITMAAAPASNSRIDAIVAYVESSPAGSATITDNPGPCGIIPVSGTASSSPAAPNDSAIRTAITADGASGTTAFYVVLAYITIPSGTTDLTADNIAAGPRVQTGAKITADNIDFTTMKKWMPNYANAQLLTNAQARAYTAPEDGFISIGVARYSADQSNYGEITVQINNIPVAKILGGPTDRGGYPQARYTGLIPICAGERMSNNAAADMDNYAWFIPGKWV